jgi:low affinity Fe/Cu permease
LAIGHQHRDHDRHLHHGISHSEHSERDAKAVHLKLDELIRAMSGARNNLVDLENLPEEELKKLADQFDRLRKRACAEAEKRAVIKVCNLQRSNGLAALGSHR